MSVDKPHPESRLVFIGGSPRSGTTLVQNMLDSHPDILGGPEFLHLPAIIKLRNQMQRDVTRGWIDIICSTDDVDRRFRRLILDFLLPFADRHEAKLMSEKTPENVLVFPELLTLLPAARFIHVVRDPRAIIASMLAVGRRAREKGIATQNFTRDSNAAIRYLKRCLDAGFEAAREAPERVLTIVYERIVQNPEVETKRLCAFLEIDWDPAMCLPSKHNHSGEQAITVKSNEIWYTAQQYNANPHTDSVGKWRTALSPAQQITASRAFRGYEPLSALGYDFSLTEIPVGARLAAGMANGLTEWRHRLARTVKRTSKALFSVRRAEP